MTQPIIERRFLTATEVRAEGSGLSISGMAVSYSAKSHNLGGFKERIARGAFTKSLRSNLPVKCLINHDNNLVLGKSSNGSLTLTDGTDGLRFRCQCTDTSYARDLITNLRAGLINQCSFSFRCLKDDYTTESDDPKMPVRTVREAELYDVSAVTEPAYPDGTTVEACARNFPMGVPAELRSSLSRLGIVLPPVESQLVIRSQMVDRFIAAVLAD